MSNIQDIITEIKTRLLLSEVISSYVKLKKSGSRYKGLCPFHNEKTPSFFVDDQKGLYHCFGCGASGDMFTFIQKIENVDFSQALKKLGKLAGVEVSNIKFDGKSSSEKELIIKINREILNLFKKTFATNKVAQKYLLNRGLKKEIIEFFELGFSQGLDKKFVDYLIKKYNVDINFLVKISFIKKYNNNIYPFFKNRIIIPIKNLWGEIVGYGGRVIYDRDNPKYLNSAENSVFQKKNILFNLNNVRKIKDNKELIIVEGYFDVITAYQNNIKNIVAPLGTAFGRSHAKIISRMFEQVYFLFDNDSAGFNATIRSIETSLEFPFLIRVIRLPEDVKDIDEFFKIYSYDDFMEVKEKSEDGVEFYLKHILQIGKSKRNLNLIYKNLFSIVRSLNDPIKEDLIFNTVEKIDDTFDRFRLREIYKDYVINNKIKIVKDKENNKIIKNEITKRGEIDFCNFLVNNLNFIEYVKEYIKPEDFEDPFAKKFYRQLLLYPNYNSDDVFFHSIDEEIQQVIFTNLEKEDYKINVNRQIEDYLSYFKLKKLKKIANELNKNIEIKSKNGDIPVELLEKKKLILEQINKLKKFRLKNRF